jgi:hypothetical protein
MVLHTPSLGGKNRRPRQNFRPRLPRDTVLVNTRFIRSKAEFSSNSRDSDESVKSALAEFLRCEYVMNRPSRPLPNGATAYHQEAIYEISEEKYFGSEEFFGQERS